MKFEELQTGDVLLFLPGSVIGRLAAIFTWSKYSHAGLVSVENGVAHCLEIMTEGRKHELAEYLRSEPTTVEVWRPREFLRYADIPEKAVAEMTKFVGLKYGWFHAIMAVTLGRFFRSKSGECSKHPPFCSEAISRAYRLAGFDLRADLADRFTFPGDLALSPYLQQVGELTTM